MVLDDIAKDSRSTEASSFAEDKMLDRENKLHGVMPSAVKHLSL
jgi:hypothetical protein